MSTPEYYKLSDGREFADFSDNELTNYLQYRVGRATYHCLISGMEHRYRRGFKAGQAAHDREAENYWTDRARQNFISCGGDSAEFSGILFIVQLMVDHERGLRSGQSNQDAE